MDNYWLIAFIRFVDYCTKHVVDPETNRRIKRAWFTKQFKANKFKEPAERDLSNLLKRKVSEIPSLVKPESISDDGLASLNGKAKSCLLNHFQRILDYKFEVDDTDGEKLQPKLDEHFRLIFEKRPQVRSITLKGDRIPYDSWVQSYLAIYLLYNNIPTISHVELHWGKDENGVWPMHARSTQASRGSSESDIIFDSIGEIYRINSASNDILYIQLKGAISSSIGLNSVIFQCVIDFHSSGTLVVAHGTFSSLRSLKNMSPTAGAVALIDGTRAKYLEARARLHLQPQLWVDSLPGDFGDAIVVAQQFIRDQIFVSKSPKKLTDSSFIRGTFRGSFFINEKIGLVTKYEFLLKVGRSGKCQLSIELPNVGLSESSKKLYGVVDIHGERIVNFRFAELMKQNVRFFNFTVDFRDSEAPDFVQFGTFSSTIFNSSAHQSGIISFRRVLHIPSDSLKTESYNINRDEFLSHIDDFESLINDENGRFPDFQIVKKLISPVTIDLNDSLLQIGLPTELKYLTFRIPDQRDYVEDDDNTVFRIEKCHLTFTDDFRSVTIESLSNTYKGKVFYNGKVILMLLNPQSQEYSVSADSYLTIQIDVPKLSRHSESTNGNYGSQQTVPGRSRRTILFGSSTWKGDKYLEAKMVVLVEPADIADGQGGFRKDDGVDVFRIGHVGDRLDSHFNALIKEDELYFGAFTYLCGRLNRHVRVYSGNGKQSILKPRHKASREPYMLAGLFLAAELRERDSDRVAIRKAKQYLFEGWLHQFGSNFHAGKVINDSFMDELDTHLEVSVVEMFSGLLEEKEELVTYFTKIKNTDIRKFMVRLWPYLQP